MPPLYHFVLKRGSARLGRVNNIYTLVPFTGDIPNALASHAARFCLLGGKPVMIVYGGTGQNFGENNSNFTNLCDLTTGHWTTLGKFIKL